MGNYGDSLQSIDDPAQRSARLGGRLARRYLFVFASVVGLVIVDQVVIQPLLARMSRYAPVINVAGRQRMLSQKLAKAALAIQSAQDEIHQSARRSELRETLATWRTAHTTLREGDAAHDIPKIQSDEIQAEWTALEPYFRAMCEAADQLVHPADEFDDKRLAAATMIIVDHEAEFLRSMDRIVALMESDAAAAVVRLRVSAAAIAAAIILLLVGLGWFVIRPATRTIRGQLDMLELAVAARTRELSSALAVIQREVQEREMADSRSQRLAAQLAHAGRVSSLGHLATGLAHELNQPLATIANYSEACDIELGQMAKDARIDRLTKHFNQAKQAALRAGQIIRRMRNFVRPNAPSAVDVKIESLIREVVELCRTEISHAGAELTVVLGDERAVVEVDPIQIQQVLVNLIQNGLQAMCEIPIDRRRLEVRSTALVDTIRIEVTDSGPGFATSDVESLFAPFHTTKRDGLGIGLAISRSIVEQHGGTIWAEMPAGGGAHVVFVLPLVESYARLRCEPVECVCR